jgi:hypothetical protein
VDAGRDISRDWPTRGRLVEGGVGGDMSREGWGVTCRGRGGVIPLS